MWAPPLNSTQLHILVIIPRMPAHHQHRQAVSLYQPGTLNPLQVPENVDHIGKDIANFEVNTSFMPQFPPLHKKFQDEPSFEYKCFFTHTCSVANF